MLTDKPTLPPGFIPHSLGAAIRYARYERNMNLADVAKSSGLSVSYLSDIERGRTIPPLRSLSVIAHALGHTLHVSLSEAGETQFACTHDEAELLYALRLRNFDRFMLMAAAILNELKRSGFEPFEWPGPKDEDDQ